VLAAKIHRDQGSEPAKRLALGIDYVPTGERERFVWFVEGGNNTNPQRERKEKTNKGKLEESCSFLRGTGSLG
jgi:hypothetical protein